MHDCIIMSDVVVHNSLHNCIIITMPVVVYNSMHTCIITILRTTSVRDCSIIMLWYTAVCMTVTTSCALLISKGIQSSLDTINSMQDCITSCCCLHQCALLYQSSSFCGLQVCMISSLLSCCSLQHSAWLYCHHVVIYSGMQPSVIMLQRTSLHDLLSSSCCVTQQYAWLYHHRVAVYYSVQDSIGIMLLFITLWMIVLS